MIYIFNIGIGGKAAVAEAQEFMIVTSTTAGAGGAGYGMSAGVQAINEGAATTAVGYHDVNSYIGGNVGIVAGRIWTPTASDPSKIYEYAGFGVGASYPPIPAGIAFTYTPFYNPIPGPNYALQINLGISIQLGYSPGGGFYWESGVGVPFGFQFQYFYIKKVPFFQ